MSDTHIRGFQESLRNEVERDLPREVLEKLKKHITDNDLIKDVALLLGRLTNVERRYHTDGDILSDEYRVESNGIRKGVLQIIESLSDENCIYPDPSTHESSEGHPIGTITPSVTEDFEIYSETPFAFYKQLSYRHESVFTDPIRLRSNFDREKNVFAYDFFRLFVEDGAVSKYYKEIEDSKLLLVLGHPGYGKTFYCKKLAHELSMNNKSSISHDNLTIPCYFPASGLTEHQVDDFCRDPLKFITDSAGNGAVPNLIIIDGITESILSYGEIVNAINKISKIKKDDNIKTKCIITSRSFYFLPDDLKTNLTIFLKPATIEESGLPKFIKTAGVYDSIPVGLRAIPGFLRWVAQRGEYEDDQLTYDLFLNYVDSNLKKLSERIRYSFNQTIVNELFSFVLAEVHKQEKVDLQYIVSELRASSINFQYKNEDEVDLFKKLSEILSAFYIRLDDYNSNSHKLVLDIDKDVQNVFLANYLYNEKLAQFSNRDIRSDDSLKIFWECFVDFKMDNSIFQLLVKIAKREKIFPRSSDDIKRFIKQTTIGELSLENGVGANSKLFLWDYISGFYYWWHFLKAVNANDNLLPQNEPVAGFSQ